jgi:LSD1 subclass zinc finger protein
MVCATCRKPIALGARYVRCTVASCNTGRMKLRFCGKPCWEKHVPTARHRNAGFVEEGPGAEPKAGPPESGD